MIIARSRLLFFALLLLFFSSNADAQITPVTTTNTQTATISETVTPCNTPLLRTFNVTNAFTVADVNLGVLLSHTYRGDLLMYLTSPLGTRIQFFTGTGTTANNFNVLLDDSAAASVTGHNANDSVTVAPYQRQFQPSSSFTGFNGQNAVGTWTLEICDRFNQDSGVFQRSDLIITPAPATLSITKISSIISDGISNSNPKSIPGAVVNYCIAIGNAGPGIAATSTPATSSRRI